VNVVDGELQLIGRLRAPGAGLPDHAEVLAPAFAAAQIVLDLGVPCRA
jgi:hypothetical protein